MINKAAQQKTEQKLKPSNNRPVISILMLFGFLTILVTGLLSYTLRYSSLLSAIHTIFGLLFVGYGIFHLKNNLRPILSYFSNKRGKRWAYLSALLIPITVGGAAVGLPPFQTIVDAGYALKELKPIDRKSNETIYTRYQQTGRPLSIEVKAGEHYSGPGAVILGITTTAIPQMAIWLEDSEGQYLETLYVTKKASNSSYLQSLFGAGARRPEALPHWSYARGIPSSDGLMMPSKDQPIADAITGATPLSSFDLRSISKTQNTSLVVKLEVNRSFDYNQTYHPGAFPEDLIYSGTGNSAQPSLIYAAAIDFEAEQPYTFMKLIGRGHHSGKDGNIYKDLSGISTARKMIERVIIQRL